MAKYDNFNREKYKNTFDEMFGTGRYDQGMTNAQNIGKAKVEASLARKEYEARRKAEEAAAKKAAKEKEKQDAIAASMAPADSKKKEDSKKQSSSNNSNPLESLAKGAKTFVDGFNRAQARAIDTLTGGLFSNQSKKQERETGKAKYTYFDEREGAGKALDIASDMGGYLIGGIGATAALRGAGLTGKGINALSKAHKAGNVTKPILKRGALDSLKEGALVGGGMASLESAMRGAHGNSRGASDELKHIALGTALGGALDPLITAGMPALKMASRSAMDDIVGKKAAEDVISGLREAKRNPVAAGDVIQEQMRQNATIRGMADRSYNDRALKMLTDSQVPSRNTAGQIDLLNPQAQEARQIMQNISDSGARKMTNIDAEDSLQQLIGRERAKLQSAQTNREVAMTTEPKVNQSHSAPSDPFNVLVSPRTAMNPEIPVNNNRSFIDRTIREPKADTRTALTKAQQSFTNDTAAIRQIDEQMKKLDADGLMNYLNPKTLISSRTKQLATDSSLEKSLLNAKGAHSVAANHVTNRFSSFLESVNKTSPKRVQELGDYAFAKHGMKLLENSADSKAMRDGLMEEIEQLKSSLGANSDEVKAMQELLDGHVNYQLPEGATADVLQQQIARFEQDPLLVKQYDDFIKLQQENLKDMYDGGMITKDLYEKLLENKTYISMHRNFDEVSSMNGMSSRRPQTPLDRMRQGSEAMIKDPVSEAIRNAYLTRFNIEKNNALQVVNKFAKIDKEGAVFRGTLEPNSNTITIFNNGKPKHYEVPPALKAYVDNFNANQDPDVLTNVVQKLAQMQRKLTTQYNLSFQLKSLVREPVQAIVTSRTAKTSLHATKNVALGYVDALVGPQLQELTKGLPKHLQFNSYKANWDKMGGTGFQYIRMSDDDLQRVAKEMMNNGTVKGSIKKMNPFNVLGKFGEKVEEGARLGEFRSAKGQGYSDADAFFEATDITNYKRSGTTTKELNKYMPFLNATIQGNSRVARAFQEAPAKTITRGVTMLTSTSAAVYGMRFMDGVSDGQRQELENLSQWEKDSYVHIPVPFENNETIIAIPKAFAVGQMFMNPMERALDDYYNAVMKEESVPEHVKEGIKSTFKSFVPPYEVAGITTGYELMQNKSLFTKQEIESEFDRSAGMPKKDMEAYNQSYLTKVLSDVINAMSFSSEEGIVSPAQVDYVVKDLTGSVGTHALEASDLLRPDNAPSRTWQDQLLKPLKQFTADPTRASGRYADVQALAKVEKRDNESMTGMTEDEKNIERSKRSTQNFESAFKDINKQIQEIRKDTTLSPQEKKDAITALRKEQDSIGSQAIEWFNSFK